MLKFVEEYEAKCQNEENLPEGERYISIEEQENQIIIAIVDPFMRRVHKLVPQASFAKCTFCNCE